MKTRPDQEEEDEAVDEEEGDAALLCRHHGDLEEAGQAPHQAGEGEKLKRVALISRLYWRLRQLRERVLTGDGANTGVQ